MSPSSTRPLPTTAQGLSPDQATTLHSATKPYLCIQKLCTVPQTSQEFWGSARRLRKSAVWPGATKSSSFSCHFLVRMSIKFMPAASEISTAATSPRSSEAPKELTSDRAATAARPRSATKRLKWWPLKRSWAVEPVQSATFRGLPAKSVSSLQLDVVLVSIQIGDASWAKAPAARSCAAAVWPLAAERPRRASTPAAVQ
mmetsp:Transcript_88565/g.225440  ORF Transcript_88565/g.225440 Transcript_88565/m.225440 type:complete len:200 (+) Transcript_88565:823-1422(+)